MSKQTDLPQIVNKYLSSRNFMNQYQSLNQKINGVGGSEIDQYRQFRSLRKEAESAISDIKQNKSVFKDYSDIINLYRGLIDKIDENIDALRGPQSLMVIPQRFNFRRR